MFGFEGIWQGTAVLYDRGTHSLWMHFTGECFHGPLAGRRLRPLASGRHTTWAAWSAAHPEGDVMAPDPRHARSYFPRSQSRSGSPALPSEFPATIQSRDPRLALSELLLGVRVGEARRAYPLQRLASTPGVVAETVGGVPLTVWYEPTERSAAAFEARLDGRDLAFVREGPGRFRETSTGSTFDLEGLARDGALRDRRLVRVESLLTEWYGWFAHHPTTTVWAP